MLIDQRPADETDVCKRAARSMCLVLQSTWHQRSVQFRLLLNNSYIVYSRLYRIADHTSILQPQSQSPLSNQHAADLIFPGRHQQLLEDPRTPLRRSTSGRQVPLCRHPPPATRCIRPTISHAEPSQEAHPALAPRSAELRVRIYEFYFAGFPERQGRVPLRHIQPPLTMVSRLLRNESLGVLSAICELSVEFLGTANTVVPPSLLYEGVSLSPETGLARAINRLKNLHFRLSCDDLFTASMTSKCGCRGCAVVRAFLLPRSTSKASMDGAGQSRGGTRRFPGRL